MYAGADSLATLRNFVGENFDWLVSQLNVAPLLSASGDDNSVTGPVLSVTQQPQQQSSQDAAKPNGDFNPLKTFGYIGSSQFNHVRTISDVTALFSSIFVIIMLYQILAPSPAPSTF